MERELTSLQVREIANELVTKWDEYKNDIKLSAKNLYNIIGLKKTFEEQFRTISEALVTLFENHGCQLNKEGTGFEVPEEKAEEMNTLMGDFSNEKIKIEYSPICLHDGDEMPAALMDLLFDFIDFQE